MRHWGLIALVWHIADGEQHDLLIGLNDWHCHLDPRRDMLDGRGMLWTWRFANRTSATTRSRSLDVLFAAKGHGENDLWLRGSPSRYRGGPFCFWSHRYRTLDH